MTGKENIMFKKWKIQRLKKEARKWRLQMYAIEDNYDCGHELMEYMSPSYREARDNCNNALDKLAELDKNFPADRF